MGLLVRLWCCVECYSVRKIDSFECGLEFPLNLVLDFFHELDVLFGLKSFVLLIDNFNLLNLVLVKLDFCLKVCIFLPKVIDFLDNFFNLGLIFLVGDLIIGLEEILFNNDNLIVDLFEVVFMD